MTGEELTDTVFHLKSVLWPGFHLFHTAKDYFSLYIGYGNKYHIGTFYPRFEYEIEEDKEDQPIQNEVSKPAQSKIDDEVPIDDED